MELSGFEIFAIVIALLIVLIPIIIFVVGLTKSKVDENLEGSSSCLKWVITIIIAAIILYILFYVFSDNGIFQEYRHS